MSAAARFDPAILAPLGTRITRLATDSRSVRAGDTFVAVPGERSDGRRHIAQAMAAIATRASNTALMHSSGA